MRWKSDSFLFVRCLFILPLFCGLWGAAIQSASYAAVHFAQSHEIDGDFNRPVSLTSAEVNGEWIVVGSSYSGDGVVWWENPSNDGLQWSKQVIDATAYGAHSIQIADLGRSGDWDAIGISRIGGQIYWWEHLHGDRTEWERCIIDENFEADSIAVADLNGDGYTDVLGVSAALGELCWWAYDSTNDEWLKHTIHIEPEGFSSVTVGDVNGDGSIDVISGSSNTGDLFWWENVSGDGNFWIRRPIASGTGAALEARVADVDGDNDLDILTASYSIGQLVWFENVDRGWFYLVGTYDRIQPCRNIHIRRRGLGCGWGYGYRRTGFGGKSAGLVGESGF